MKKILTFSLVLLLALTMFVSCGKKESLNEFIINNGTEPQSLDPSKIEGVPEQVDDPPKIAGRYTCTLL